MVEVFQTKNTLSEAAFSQVEKVYSHTYEGVYKPWTRKILLVSILLNMTLLGSYFAIIKIDSSKIALFGIELPIVGTIPITYLQFIMLLLSALTYFYYLFLSKIDIDHSFRYELLFRLRCSAAVNALYMIVDTSKSELGQLKGKLRATLLNLATDCNNSPAIERFNKAISATVTRHDKPIPETKFQEISKLIGCESAYLTEVESLLRSIPSANAIDEAKCSVADNNQGPDRKPDDTINRTAAVDDLRALATSLGKTIDSLVQAQGIITDIERQINNYKRYVIIESIIDFFFCSAFFIATMVIITYR